MYLGSGVIILFLVLSSILAVWALFVYLPVRMLENKLRNEYEQDRKKLAYENEREIARLRADLYALKQKLSLAPPCVKPIEQNNAPDRESAFVKPLELNNAQEPEPASIKPLELNNAPAPESESASIKPLELDQTHAQNAAPALEKFDDEDNAEILVADIASTEEARRSERDLFAKSGALPSLALDSDKQPGVEQNADEQNADGSLGSQSREFVLPTERPNQSFGNLESLIGRKVLSWLGVVLFLLGAAFFLQLAISRGWLSPAVRLALTFAAGAVMLGCAKLAHKKGARMFSEALNSAGALAFVGAGYYAHISHTLPTSAASAIMFVSVFFGFLLAYLYKSGVVGTVVSLGGLAVPIVIATWRSDLVQLTVYMLVYMFAGLVLANLLKRSRLAAIPVFGAFFTYCTFTLWGSQLDFTEFCCGVFFFIAFGVLDMLDHIHASLRRTRRSCFADVLRAASTGPLAFFAFRALCFKAANGILIANIPAEDWFDQYSGYLALASAFVYFAARFVTSRPRPFDDLEAPTPQNERKALDRLSLLDVPCAFLFVAFAFLAVAVNQLFSRQFAAVAFLALSTGLHLFAAYRLNAFKLPSFVEKIKSDARQNAAIAAFERAAALTARLASGWGFAYFLIGLFFLCRAAFLPNLYAFGDYVAKADSGYVLTGALPFLGKHAIPTTLAVIALFAAACVFAKPMTNKLFDHDGKLVRPAFDRALKRVRFYAEWSVVAACVVGIVHSSSQLYAYVGARALAFKLEHGGVVACEAVLLFWLAASAIAFIIGLKKKSSALRIGANIVWLFVAFKLLALNLPCAPLFGEENLRPLLADPYAWQSRAESLASQNLLDAKPWAPCLPLFNAFSLPFFAAAVIGAFYAVALRWKKLLDGPLALVSGSISKRESRLALTSGLVALTLFWTIAGLDAYSYYRFQPDRFNDPTFYAAHALWIVWLLIAASVMFVGRIAKSLPIRAFAYCVAAIAFFCVVGGEFCSGGWRVNHKIVKGLWNPAAIPAALWFAWLTARRWLALRSQTQGKRENVVANVYTCAGIAGIFVLLSFETYRYFTGKTWFGGFEWTRLLALSIFWSCCVVFFRWLAYRVKGGFSIVCAWISNLIAVAVLIHYLGFELFNTRYDHSLLFFNSFFYATAIVVLLAAGLGLHYKKRARTKNDDKGALTPDQIENAKFMRSVSVALISLAVVLLWLGSSVDVYSFYREPGGSNFAAQAALSVVWTLFAGLLLTFGFLRREALLRWFAIAIFGCAAFKVLAIDLSYLDSLYRVAGFMCLGVVTLLASAAYWKRRPKDANANSR